MVVSVNTNAGAMLALQALRATSKQLAVSQLRITTGLKVNGPQDDPATFSHCSESAGGHRRYYRGENHPEPGRINGRRDGAAAVSDLLTEMKAKAVQSGRHHPGRAATGVRLAQPDLVGTADFNQKNLIESAATELRILSSVEGSVITVSAQPDDTTTLAIRRPDASTQATAVTGSASLAAGGVRALRSTRLPAGRAGTFRRWAA